MTRNDRKRRRGKERNVSECLIKALAVWIFTRQTSRLVNVHRTFAIAACMLRRSGGLAPFFAFLSVFTVELRCLSHQRRINRLLVSAQTRYAGKKMKDRRMKRQTGCNADVPVVRRGNIWGRIFLEHDWWRIKRRGKRDCSVLLSGADEAGSSHCVFRDGRRKAGDSSANLTTSSKRK